MCHNHWKEKIVIKVTDTNSVPYEFSKNFTILKKNEKYVEPTFDPSRVIGENTANSTAGYLGPQNPSFEWEELIKVSDSNESEEIHSVDEESKTVIMEFDIRKKYGELLNS